MALALNAEQSGPCLYLLLPVLCQVFQLSLQYKQEVCIIQKSACLIVLSILSSKLCSWRVMPQTRAYL